MIVTENSTPATVEVYKKGDSAYLQYVEGGGTMTLAQFEQALIDNTTAVADAQQAAAAALVSEQNAATSETNAGTSETNAGLSAAAALASEQAAALSETATGQDAIATAADRVQTGLDRTATGLDKIATAADRVQTGLDRIATGADRTQTGLDRIATGADRVQTGLDAASADADATTATTKAAEAAASAAAAALYAQAIAKGNWNAATNSPTLANGTGTVGWWYYVSTAGTSLSQTFIEGDVVFYNGSTWVRIPKVFAIPNSSWWQSYDYAGNLVNTWRYNSDNEFEWAQPIKIAALRHVLNQGLVEICNIPVSAASAAGTAHGYKLVVGNTTILEVAAKSDGAGSVTGGYLIIPKMTTTQRDAIPSPTEGMMIYNLTTHVLNFYNGSAWGAV